MDIGSDKSIDLNSQSGIGISSRIVYDGIAPELYSIRYAMVDSAVQKIAASGKEHVTGEN